MQEAAATTAPVVIEMTTAAAAPDFASQAANYAATDASIFAATQAAAASSVAAARDLVGNGAQMAQTATQAATAAGTVAVGTAAGFALPIVLGTLGVAGLCAGGYYAWKNKGYTLGDIKRQVSDRLNRQSTPGEYPQWQGWTDEAIWNDDRLLDEATRPAAPAADEFELDEIDWDALELECAAR